MLVGYSLEVCLKAMLIIRKGGEEYAAQGKKFHHHELVELAAFVPDLSDKDKAILEILTHFIKWAGRYPDPGSGKEDKHEEIFSAAEARRVTAADLFRLATRIMQHARKVTGAI